nr:Blp family class II bacteriocin [Treponema sp.]
RKMDIDERAIQEFDEKYDMEEISLLVDQASNPEEAIDFIHKLYPELQVEEIKKQCEFIAQQLKAEQDSEKGEIQELTEEELSNVAGGGLFDWFDDLSYGWQCVVKGAVAGVVAAAAVAVVVGATITVPTIALVKTAACAGAFTGLIGAFVE